MSLHWALRHGVWASCSFFARYSLRSRIQKKRPINLIASKQCFCLNKCVEFPPNRTLSNVLNSQASVLYLLQPRRYGGFWGDSHPKQSSKRPQIETSNTINQLSFCQFLECQARPHKPKTPAKTQSPLIETFWRRFCPDPVHAHLWETVTADNGKPRGIILQNKRIWKSKRLISAAIGVREGIVLGGGGKFCPEHNNLPWN